MLISTGMGHTNSKMKAIYFDIHAKINNTCLLAWSPCNLWKIQISIGAKITFRNILLFLNVTKYFFKLFVFKLASLVKPQRQMVWYFLLPAKCKVVPEWQVKTFGVILFSKCFFSSALHQNYRCVSERIAIWLAPRFGEMAIWVAWIIEMIKLQRVIHQRCCCGYKLTRRSR